MALDVLLGKMAFIQEQGKAITTCDHIFIALQPFFEQYPEAILDGELYNHETKSMTSTRLQVLLGK